MKIKLYNRDGADLRLEKSNKEVSPNIFVWTLETDKKHEFVLEYCRIIRSPNNIDGCDAIDPSGGPFISVGDEFEGKYKIVRIYDAKNIWISERDNNN